MSLESLVISSINKIDWNATIKKNVGNLLNYYNTEADNYNLDLKENYTTFNDSTITIHEKNTVKICFLTIVPYISVFSDKTLLVHGAFPKVYPFETDFPEMYNRLKLTIDYVYGSAAYNFPINEKSYLEKIWFTSNNEKIGLGHSYDVILLPIYNINLEKHVHNSMPIILKQIHNNLSSVSNFMNVALH